MIARIGFLTITNGIGFIIALIFCFFFVTGTMGNIISRLLVRLSPESLEPMMMNFVTSQLMFYIPFFLMIILSFYLIHKVNSFIANLLFPKSKRTKAISR